MATRRWQGGATAVAQVNTWTFAGTWLVGETVTFTYGSMTWTYTLASTVIATFLAAMDAAYDALSATAYPAHAEQTAGSTATTLTLTADTAGKPFTVTVSTNSASGTINGGASSTGTATTASAGPYDWSTAKNWSAATLPVDGDAVIIDLGNYSILYGLSQTSIDLASLTIDVDDDTWGVGLPELNEDATAYFEYRTTSLSLGTATAWEVTTTSARVKLDLGANAFTGRVYATGTGQDAEALLLKGTHASNALTVQSGCEVGVAVYANETANLSGGLTVGQGATVRCGSGATLALITNTGGDLEVNSAVTTRLDQTAGTTTINGTGAVAAIDASGGTINYNTSGTLGDDVELSGSAVLTFAGDQRTKTVPAGIDLVGPSASILDPQGVATGGSDLTVNLFEGATAGQVDWGWRDISLTRATVP